MTDEAAKYFETHLLSASDDLVAGKAIKTDSATLVKNLTYFYTTYLRGQKFDTGCPACVRNVLRHSRTAYKQHVRTSKKA